jgi:hypothetical protein
MALVADDSHSWQLACVALAELEDALVWLARQGAGALAARVRRLGQFDRDGVVSVRALLAVLDDADDDALDLACRLPRVFACPSAQALRDGARAKLTARIVTS